MCHQGLDQAVAVVDGGRRDPGGQAVQRDSWHGVPSVGVRAPGQRPNTIAKAGHFAGNDPGRP
jgi:hypothetical protein